MKKKLNPKVINTKTTKHETLKDMKVALEKWLNGSLDKINRSTKPDEAAVKNDISLLPAFMHVKGKFPASDEDLLKFTDSYKETLFRYLQTDIKNSYEQAVKKIFTEIKGTGGELDFFGTTARPLLCDPSNVSGLLHTNAKINTSLLAPDTALLDNLQDIDAGTAFTINIPGRGSVVLATGDDRAAQLQKFSVAIAKALGINTNAQGVIQGAPAEQYGKYGPTNYFIGETPPENVTRDLPYSEIKLRASLSSSIQKYTGFDDAINVIEFIKKTMLATTEAGGINNGAVNAGFAASANALVSRLSWLADRLEKAKVTFTKKINELNVGDIGKNYGALFEGEILKVSDINEIIEGKDPKSLRVQKFLQKKNVLEGLKLCNKLSDKLNEVNSDDYKENIDSQKLRALEKNETRLKKAIESVDLLKDILTEGEVDLSLVENMTSFIEFIKAFSALKLQTLITREELEEDCGFILGNNIYTESDESFISILELQKRVKKMLEDGAEAKFQQIVAQAQEEEAEEEEEEEDTSSIPVKKVKIQNEPKLVKKKTLSDNEEAEPNVPVKGINSKLSAKVENIENKLVHMIKVLSISLEQMDSNENISDENREILEIVVDLSALLGDLKGGF